MVRPSHRLDLLIVPYLQGLSPTDARALWQALVARRVIDAEGQAGDQAPTWCAQGFSRITLDWIPASDGGSAMAMYTSGPGGFLVRCPHTGSVVTAAFGTSLSQARAGTAPWSLCCPSCSETHPFGQLDIQPPAAFGRFAVVTVDVGGPVLVPDALAWCRSMLGSVAVVLRRG